MEFKPKRLVPPVVLAAMAVYYMSVAGSFSDSTSAEAPILYGTVLLVLCVLAFVTGLVPREKEVSTGLGPKTKHRELDLPATLKIFGLIGGFVALVFLVGFYIAIPLFLGLFLRLISRASWLAAGLSALAAYGFVYAVFGYFLNLEVYPGYLFNLH